MPDAPLNPDALAEAIDTIGRLNVASVEPAIVGRVAIETYLAVAQPEVTGEQVNLAGWTCDGIHEPGSYATCEDCRGACDDLANFYNQMRSTPNASGPWTYRPEGS